MYRAEQLLHLGWRWLQCGELTGEFVHRQHVLVAIALVLAHRFVERASSGEGLVQCDRTAFGVAESVTDSLSRDRIPIVAGVDHTRPTRPVRLAEEIRHGC